MDERTPLAALLARYTEARGYRRERLAREAGVPVATIHRWFHGSVAAPYQWENMLKVAATLRLTKAQTNLLLRAAGLPPLARLAVGITDVRTALFAPWESTGWHNLPAEVTSFVGRDTDVLEIATLLCEPDVRLVTLTGPGGSGKTRLALRVSRELLDAFPDGVFFVACAPLSDSALVMPAIARVLGVREVAGEPYLGRLKAYLSDRRALLLLDNLEHLPECGPGIVDLLTAAPGLTVLATSRSALHVSGEHERPVAPLPLPDSGADFTDVRGNPALDLFAARARAANPDFVLTRGNASDVATICARLDGLPLAIELAAARVRQIPPSELLNRFPSSLDLSADGPRDVDERQRTLRATIAWSIGLLGSAESALFALLAVFAGGWTNEDAIAVCQRVDEQAIDVPRCLLLLIEASLIERVPDSSGTARYQMLETIREFAIERLVESGQQRPFQRAHAEHFLALAEAAEPYVPETRQGDWLMRIDTARDNLRAALTWALTHDAPLATQLGAALWPYWHEFSVLHEGRRWLAMALERAGADLASPTRATPHRRGCPGVESG